MSEWLNIKEEWLRVPFYTEWTDRADVCSGDTRRLVHEHGMVGRVIAKGLNRVAVEIAYQGRFYYGWITLFGVGSRVELSPGCDLWMRGARFGTVDRIDEKRRVILVKMDHPSVKRLQRFVNPLDLVAR